MALIDKVRVIKLLLFALFMMVSMVTPAQSQVDWSIKAGIGMANIIGDNMGSPKVKLAYKLGIGLECPFDKIWSLQTGVSFVSKGTNHTIVETDGISAQAKVNASYLELPVMVAARFAMDRNTYILVAAGPYGAWGIGGKTKALGYSWSSSSTPDWNTGNVVEIGLSVEYRHYVIGVEGRLGLCKLQKELQGKNITGFVTAGYKF